MRFNINKSPKSIFIQLLTLTWVALLVSCASNPSPTTQPTFEATASAPGPTEPAATATQEVAPEPTEPATMETQELAAAESSSMAGDTVLPEEKVYWPTEAWRVATPDEQGMDAALLQQMLDAIDEQNLNIDGVVVVHNSYIVTEKYYPPYKQDTLHDMYSITKSVVSALIGIAIQQGYINSVDDLVLDFFPERTFENDDALKRSITLEHLLTMSSGLEGDDHAMVSSRDCVQAVLDQPMTIEPGTEFNYNSGNAHVLSAIIQKTSGLNTRDFAQQVLFDPLGISDLTWQMDINDIPNGGWGMAMKPRDMAKLGYLYLNQGVWDGRQIVPAGWIKATMERHIQVPDPLEPWDLYLGYLWWLHEDGPYAAHGMKGQFIYVIPESDLVVVFTSNIPDAEFAQPQLLIRNYIIPAVTPE
jgi:CubicO group peptidase (beta-lactamase class C family)